MGGGFEDILKPCLFGTGQLEESGLLPIKTSFADLDSFDDNLKIISQMSQIKLSPTYDATLKLIDQRAAWTIPSSLEEVTAKTTLNSWANYDYSASYQQALGTCSASRDTIEETEAKCSGTKLTSVTSPSAPNAVCVGLDKYTYAQFATRYTSSAYASCKLNPSSDYSSVQDAILKNINSLKTYMGEMATEFAAVKTDLAAAKVSHDSLADVIIA